jgi:hypothetical protein
MFFYGWCITHMALQRMESSGKLTVCELENCHVIICYPCLMGKSTISIVIFNSFLYVYQRVIICGTTEKIIEHAIKRLVEGKISRKP